jgi:hypothetical protein
MCIVERVERAELKAVYETTVACLSNFASNGLSEGIVCENTVLRPIENAVNA